MTNELNLNDRSWYVATMDDGVFSGPFRTKRLAMNRTDGTCMMPSMHRIHAGMYLEYGSRGRGFYVGTGYAMKINGFEDQR